MMTPHAPHILQSVHPWARWIRSVQDRQTPDGLPIKRLRLIEITHNECLPYLFPTDPAAAGAVTAGEPPTYLGPGRAAGEGWFLLTAPCVVWLWTLDANEQLRSEAIVVLSRRQLRTLQRAHQHPTASLMRGVVDLVHQPKPKQLEVGQWPEGGEHDAH